VLAAILGALPATALGVLAFMGVIAGSQGFTRDKTGAALFLVWGVLGVAGAAGLWLGALGRDPRSAIPLTVCGLIAAAPLVAVGLAAAFVGEPSWLLLAIFPFGIGAVYVIRGVRRRRLWRQLATGRCLTGRLSGPA
jgi:hypothetical protein